MSFLILLSIKVIFCSFILSGTVHIRGESPQDWLEDVWTCLNDLGFSLYTILSICYVVVTSDGKMKFEMEVNANWCVAIEYWRSSIQ